MKMLKRILPVEKSSALNRGKVLYQYLTGRSPKKPLPSTSSGIFGENVYTRFRNFFHFRVLLIKALSSKNFATLATWLIWKT